MEHHAAAGDGIIGFLAGNPFLVLVIFFAIGLFLIFRPSSNP